MVYEFQLKGGDLMHMRTNCRIVMILFALLCLFTLSAYAEGVPEPTVNPNASPYDKEHPEVLEEDQLVAAAAIVIEESSGNPIFEKNPYERMYPASTTKIMTVLLALQHADLDEVVTVSYAASADGVKAMLDPESSTLGLREGEKIVMKDLLYGTMLRSGNDGTIAIAEHIAGSTDAFVQMMNSYAAELGMDATHFVNVHGLHHPDHYTTAYDMAILAREAMQNDVFRDIVSSVTYNMPETNERSARTITTGPRILNPSETNYYYEPITGIKSGYHSMAQYCFVGSATKDGVDLISVVFCSNRYYVWYDTEKLMDYGFSQYEHVTLTDLYQENPITVYATGYDMSDQALGELELSCAPRDAGVSAEITATHDEIKNLAQTLRNLVLVEYTRELKAPITAGEVIGTMTYLTEDGDPIVYDLLATRSIAGRASAPMTVDQIIAKTDSDDSLPPNLTEPFLIFIGVCSALTAIIVSVILMLRRVRRRYARLPRNKNRYVK